ncbi:MAG: hypothetical protein JRG71_15715 [Deltaproteobacteria bacterium]|nr:hypothetical protein [Deltaproteobacteria bacterium]
MIGNWEFFGIGESTRYFEFAISYLKASEDVCRRMKTANEENTWSNASVALMLAAHSVELFIKGALMVRGYQDAWGHTIDHLYDKYKVTFPEKCFCFDCPFVTEYLGYSSEEIEKQKNVKRPQASVVFRYPLNKPGLEWDVIHGVDVSGFSSELTELKHDFNRLKKLFNDILRIQ